MTRLRPLLAAAFVLLIPAAQAQVLPPPLNVVTLSASATVEVQKDLLSVVLSTTREGADAATVKAQLTQALDAALAEARKAALPGQIDVHTGNFGLFPRYTPKGGINGWQGSAEMVIEGRDVAGIAQLAGRIQSLSVARVGFSLSREARAKVDADVTAQAIDQFRARAAFVSKQFGFGTYSIREISVGGNENAPVMMPMVRAMAMPGGADAALPVEAGKASVTVSVNGSIQMAPGR